MRDSAGPVRSVQIVRDLVSAVDAFDATERHHIDDTLVWLASTDDIFRRRRPATPPKHLVSYVVVTEPRRRAIYLVDHRKAGLWLPTGGHVEPGEHPRDTARRELREELGVDAEFTVTGDAPLFVTVTTTVGIGTPHVDVSLWYLVAADHSTSFTLDPDEFRCGRWWTTDEIETADPAQFDPNFARFVRKQHSTLDPLNPVPPVEASSR